MSVLHQVCSFQSKVLWNNTFIIPPPTHTHLIRSEFLIKKKEEEELFFKERWSHHTKVILIHLLGVP